MQSAFRQQILGLCSIKETKSVPPTLYKVNEADAAPAAAPATPDPAVDAAAKATTDLFTKLQAYINKDAMPLMNGSKDPIFAALTNIVPQLNAIATQLKNNKVAGMDKLPALTAPVAATVDAAAKKKADDAAAAAKKATPPAPPAPPTQKPGTAGAQAAPGAAQPAATAAPAAPTKPGATPSPTVPAAK